MRLAKWLSLNPAKALGLNNRGRLKKGYFADIIVWNPYEHYRTYYDPNTSKHESVFADVELYGNIHQVYVRGDLMYGGENIEAAGKHIYRAK